MKAIFLAMAFTVLAGCNQSAPSSADATNAASGSEMDKQFGNLNTGRVVNGASSGDCDASCQSRIKK
ncbi:hypothetical protein B0G84_8838 [Paraburkholderia sp. BL8N3]|nr:hypothetical protein [Paraburkholderia sp. BL8N3]TCK31784.1 hypothetical protein B0G84_8838 [Paraburkholderia sp. BL8N3]